MARKPGSEKVLSRRVLVTVSRSGDPMCTTPKVVWQHEIPILESIFGEGQVKAVPPETMDEGYSPKASPDMLIWTKRQDQVIKPSDASNIGFVFAGDHEAEWYRLASVYGKCSDKDELVVERVYGRVQSGRFSDMVGEAEYADMPDAQLREIIVQHGYLPTTTHDSTKEEIRAAEEERRKLFALQRAELMQLVADVAGALA